MIRKIGVSIILLFTFLFSSFESEARHVYGGNINYIYQGDTVVFGQTLHAYAVVLTLYYDCTDTRWPFTTSETVTIYEGPLNATSLPNSSKVTDVTVTWVDSTTLTANLPTGCAVTTNVCVGKVNYAGIALVPPTFTGYHFVFDRCCRQVLANINGAVNTVGSLFHSWTASTATKNTSPIFRDLERPFICANQNKTAVNLAVDPDGNQLNYEFYHPFDGEASSGSVFHTTGYNTWPPKLVVYNSGYSVSQPFGPTGSASINGITGVTSIKAPVTTGEYVVGVKVKEIDPNGFTVGVVHREFQFPVIPCNDTNNTVPRHMTGLALDHTVEEGDSICFDLGYENVGQSPISFSVLGEPLLPTTNPRATLGTVQSTSTTVKQQLCWKTSCSQGRSTKYFLTASASNSACLPGDTTIVYSVTVEPFAGPQSIIGPQTVCSGASNMTYTTDTITGATYNWTVTGGTVVSGGTGPSITINWGTGTGGNIQVNATSRFGCQSALIDQAVRVNNFPVDPGADRSICLGDTTTLGGSPTAPAGYTYQWTPSSSLNNDTSANPLAFPTGTIKYLVTVTDTSGQCTSVDSVLVTVLQNSNAGIDTRDTTICQGDQIQLLASGGRFYKWAPSTSLNNDTIANPVTNIDSTTLFFVTITDTGSVCPAVDSVLVTVDSKEQINAGTDSTICVGETYQIGANPNGPTGSTYLWTPSTFLSSNTSGNPTITPTSGFLATNYILQVTTPTGCTFLDTVVIAVDTLPNVQVVSNLDSICAGDTATLVASGTLNNNYSWIPSTLPQGVSTQTVAPSVTTKYLVTGTDDNGCSASDSITLKVNPIPEITIPHDTVFLCFGDTLQLTSTPGGTGYRWTPNTTILPNDTVPNPRVFPSVNTTYNLTVADFGGCSGNDSIHILVDTVVPVDPGVTQTNCIPDTIQIGGNPTSPVFNSTFSWSPGSSLVDSTVASPLTFTSVATMYVVTVRNGNCVGIDSVQVNVSTPPSITYTQNTYDLCKGDTLMFDTVSTSGTINSFRWSPTAGLVDSTTLTPLVFSDTSRVYTVTYFDTLGCQASTSLNLQVTTNANIVATDTTACTNQLIALHVTGGTTYNWTPGSVLNDSTSANPIANLDTTTTFVVTGVNSFGCTGSDTITVQVFPRPQADAGGPFYYCDDATSSIQLGGTPTGPTGSTYAWSSPTLLDDVTAANPTTFSTLLKTYYVIVTDTNGCQGIDSTEVNRFSFTATGGSSNCNGDSTQLNVTNVYGTAPISYLWSPGYKLSDSTIANPISTTDSTINYKVIVSDTNGCIDSTEVTVSLENASKARFEFEILANCDNALGRTVNLSENADDYSWYLNGAFFSNDQDIEFPLEFNQPASLLLVASNSEPCIDSSLVSQQVLAFEDYFTGIIPNVFTPNSDGFNDIFDVQVGQRLEQCTDIKIFNRWGIMVYESRGVDHSWDGNTFTGEACQQGVYFYTLNINGTIYNGQVTLLRD